MVYKLNKNRDNYYLSIDKGTYHEVIAHSFDGGKQILSLKNCKAIELGYDLEELVEKCADEYADRFDYNDGQGNREVYSNRDVIEKVYIIAFQKALEILGDKKFSEEDIVKAFIAGQKYGEDLACSAEIDVSPNRKEYIKSLQQTEWDVEIEMECPQCKEYGYISECRNVCNKKFIQPKLDAGGCLILKRK